MAGRPDVAALENLRLAQVYRTVLRYMLDIAVDRGPLAGARRRTQFWLHDVPVQPVALGTATKMRLLLQELGPTYVKVGQLVSSQSHVLPDDWERELTRLQQNVAPFPYDDVRRIMVEDLGAPPEHLYERFETVPLAAASLGQVHRARVDGEEVVVKVRRPGAARPGGCGRRVRQERAVRVGLLRRGVQRAPAGPQHAGHPWRGHSANPHRTLLGPGADDAVRGRRDDHPSGSGPGCRDRSGRAL
jgi:hypothetical protein